MSNILESSADRTTNRSGGSGVSPASSLHSSRGWLSYALLLLFIALAFARGVYGLGSQSLWWDESLSLQRASYDLPHILSNEIVLTDATRQLVTFDNHPPLYFLLLHFMIRLAGQSEFVLRFPSLASSVLTVPLLYALGKCLFDQRIGLLAAFFGAISPLYLWYSHEARMYTMLTFLGLLSFYTLLRILTPSAERQMPNAKRPTSNFRLPTSYLIPTIIYILSSVAMLATHYLGFLILLAELVVFFSFLRRAKWWRIAIPVFGVLLIALPISYYGFPNLPRWELGGFRFISLLELLQDVSNSFSLGISVKAKQVLPVHWVFRSIFVIGSLTIVWRAFRPLSPRVLSALIYLLVPVFSIYLLSYIQPIYLNIRHLIVASPAFYLILALGLATIKSKWPLIFVSCLALMVAGSAHSTQQYFYNDKYTKDDHRAWGEYLKAHAQPGDIIVVDPPQISQLYLYYADAGLPWTGLPRLVSPEEATISALKELMAGYERIWLAFSGIPDWGDPERLPEKWLEENAFLVDERSFHNYASVVQTSCFLTASPVLDTPPDAEHPVEANFEDKLLFLGYDLEGKPAVAGQFVRLNLYWKALREMGEDCGISLRLLDGENRLWGQADRAPLNGHYPTSQWQPGQIVKDDYELLVDAGTPPGWYSLEMVVHDGRQDLAIIGEDLNPWGTVLDIGIMEVKRPTSPPSPASLSLEHRRGMDFGDLQLLGYDLAEGSYRPGDWVSVRPYWRVERKLAEDYSFYFRLVDENKRLWAQQVIRPAGDGYPTSFWDEGEIVKGQHALRIPADAPMGDYYVGIVLREPEIVPSGGLLADLMRFFSSDGNALDLGKIHVMEVQREFEVPAIQHPHQANFAGLVEFLGYDLAKTELSSGDVLPLTLYWRALGQMDTSYTVFTHLIDEDNRIWGQQDNPPQKGGHPTTRWVKGEVVTDSYTIPAKLDAPPGEYVIEIGLYNAATGERLPVLDEQGENVVDDRVLLQQIWVIKEKR
jgi:mannosyltransferase